MREANTDSNHIDRLQGRNSTDSDERIVYCVIFLFLIVLIAGCFNAAKQQNPIFGAKDKSTGGQIRGYILRTGGEGRIRTV